MIYIDSPEEMARKSDEAIAAWKRLSQAERLQRLQEYGILDKNHKLSSRYAGDCDSEAMDEDLAAK